MNITETIIINRTHDLVLIYSWTLSTRTYQLGIAAPSPLIDVQKWQNDARTLASGTFQKDCNRLQIPVPESIEFVNP